MTIGNDVNHLQTRTRNNHVNSALYIHIYLKLFFTSLLSFQTKKMLLSDLPLWTLAAFSAVLTIGTVLGIFLNSTFIIIYWTHHDLHTRPHQLFTILATTDLMVSLTVGPLHIVPLINTYAAASIWYDKLRIFTTAATISMSVYTVLIIAADRAMTIRELGSQNYSKKQMTMIITALLCAATSTPTCRLIPGHTAEIIYLIMATFTATISIGGVAASYCLLTYIVRQHHLAPGVPRTERQVTRITTRLTLTYVISLTPMIFYHVMRFTKQLPDDTLAVIYTIAITIISSTCYTNPVSYYVTNSALRTTYVATNQQLRARHARDREAQLLRYTPNTRKLTLPPHPPHTC